MREISVNLITDIIEELCIKANKQLPCDIENCLHNCAKHKTNPLGRSVLCDLEKNLETAKELDLPICQDTGMAVVFLEVGQDIHIMGGDLTDAVNEGVRRGYEIETAPTHIAGLPVAVNIGCHVNRHITKEI